MSASVSGTIVVDPEPIGDLSLSASIPNRTTVGNATNISATVSLPDATGINASGNITLNVTTPNATLAQKTINLQDGVSKTVAFSVVINQSGSVTITVSASGTVDNTSVSATVSGSLYVQGLNRFTRSGAAFAVPPTLEDEVNTYRQQIGLSDTLQAFVLAQEDALYLVFTTEEPQKGHVTVTASLLSQNFTYRNFTLGGIVASDVSFRTKGNLTTIAAVNTNTSQYRLKLVRINATYRRVSTLTDPDEGEDFTASTTVGLLVNNPVTVGKVLNQVGARAGNLSVNLTVNNRTTDLYNETRPLFNVTNKSRLPTFQFETKFWADAPANVDGIVLSPGSRAYRFFQQVASANVTPKNASRPILYTVNESFEPIHVTSVRDIKQNATALDGEVVSLNARLFQGRVSVQEALEHYTGCDETVLKIQTPQGSACVNVIQDELLHGGVAWTTVPTSRDDVLFVGGVSSRHQDDPITIDIRNRYQVIGEVVSTARFDKRLPNGSVLVIYDLQRTGPINWRAVADEAKQIIRNRSRMLRTRLQAQLNTTYQQANATQDELPVGPRGEPPSEFASFQNTSALTGGQVSPPSLGGKIRVEASVSANASITLQRNTSTNYSLSITVTGNATNVTFYLQRQAVAASQDIQNVVMYLDGEPREFYVDPDAGPGNSPWIAFQVPEFSTRNVTFSSTSDTGTTNVTLGDVNDDGAINTGDVIQVQRSIVGLSTDPAFSSTAADVNSDGNINTGDVIQIQRFIVGLSSVLE